MIKTLEKIQLNIFTNCSIYSPDVEIIKQTYISFCQTFDHKQEIPVKVFCDSHPFAERINEYVINLKRLFDEIHVTDSLSDGYLESIRVSNAPYLFQLEGDWVFNDNITHTLREIIEAMENEGIYHLRFNKRANKIAGWDKRMDEMSCGGIAYCVTNNMSNNPHIINREKYNKEIAAYIRRSPGSKGIEEMLLRAPFDGAIYGPMNYPATVCHIDGRQGKRLKI